MRMLFLIGIVALHNFALANIETLHKARKAYAANKIEKSIELYKKVSKNSPYWGFSLEEKAWGHLRLNQTPLVLAATKTLHSFPLNRLGFYESYVVQGLAELRTCRYEDVFKTIQNFKNHKMDRIQKLQDLASGVTHLEVSSQITNLDSLKKLQAVTPELTYLDKVIQSALKSKKNRGSIIANRLSVLARQELLMVERVVTQLKLIEVEAEQRVVRDAETGFKTEQAGNFKKTNFNELIFPADDNPWIDELGQFEVAMQSCQKQRRKL